MGQLEVIQGDASLPQAEGPCVIAHIVNDQGRWGSGFTRSLSTHWPESEREYRLWYRHGAIANTSLDPHKNFDMGNVRYVLVRGKWKPEGGTPEQPLWVANMAAQQGLMGEDNRRPLRYDALGACLREVGLFAGLTKSSVHMPKIGTGLAGGDWNIIKELIHDALVRNGIETYVYELAPRAA